MSGKGMVKQLLGELPFTAELYWLMRNRGKKAFTRFNLDKLNTKLPQMLAEVEPYCNSAPPGKKLFLFASLHFWISHMVVTGLALRGLGYQVTLGYLPYGDYAKPINRFDLRRNSLYARDILRQVDPVLKVVPILDQEPARELPDALARAVEQITVFDTRIPCSAKM